MNKKVLLVVFIASLIVVLTSCSQHEEVVKVDTPYQENKTGPYKRQQADFVIDTESMESDFVVFRKSDIHAIGIPHPKIGIKVTMIWAVDGKHWNADGSLITHKEGVEQTEVIREFIAHFAFDSYKLSDADREDLEMIVAKQGVLPQQVVIEGRTDSVGSEDYNRKLSLNRAKTVKEYLEGLGIAPSRLRTVGFGTSNPLATNDTPSGRAKNRSARVSIDKGNTK